MNCERGGSINIGYFKSAFMNATGYRCLDCGFNWIQMGRPQHEIDFERAFKEKSLGSLINVVTKNKDAWQYKRIDFDELFEEGDFEYVFNKIIAIYRHNFEKQRPCLVRGGRRG